MQDQSENYATFLTNVKEFKQLNQLPMPLPFEQVYKWTNSLKIKVSGTNRAT
jgi:hypothetical protein